MPDLAKKIYASFGVLCIASWLAGISLSWNHKALVELINGANVGRLLAAMIVLLGLGGAVYCVWKVSRLTREGGEKSEFWYQVRTYGVSGDSRTTMSKPLVMAVLGLGCAVGAVVVFWVALQGKVL